MTILVHPTYFPTIAHFVAFANAEEIIFEKEDNFQKQTYRNRMFIYAANGKLLLNIPVQHDKKGNKIRYEDIQIKNDEDWQKQHWKSIESAYRTSPFFEYYEDDLKSVFFQPQTSLYDLNIAIFKIICECIELDISTSFTEAFHKDYLESSVVDLRNLTLAKKGVQIELEPYTQVFGMKHGYENNLSILDLLFNEGPNTLNYLESQQRFW